MAESSKSSSAARNELGAIKKRLEPVLYNGTPPGEHGSQSTKHGSHLVRWPSLAVKEALDLVAALPYEVVPAVPQSRPPQHRCSSRDFGRDWGPPELSPPNPRRVPARWQRSGRSWSCRKESYAGCLARRRAAFASAPDRWGRASFSRTSCSPTLGA